MRMKKHRTCNICLLLAIPLLLSTAMAFDFSEIENKVVKYELDNGLRIMVLPQHDVPVAAFITLVNAGGCDDPKGAAGLAHMFEHMAFKGTKDIGTTDYKKEKKWMDEEDRIFSMILEERAKLDYADSTKLVELDSLFKIATDSAGQYIVNNEFGQIYESEGGVDLNAGTGYDYTAYFAKYPANKLELWMAMESDRFLNPVLRGLFQEKEVVAEERRMSRESSPQGKMQDEFIAAAFTAHPYGRSLIGPMSDIQNFNRPIMRQYFSKYYMPRNMIIAIVGDVTPEHVYRLAKEYFGRLPDVPKPDPVMTIEAAPFAERRVIIKDKTQPIYLTSFHIPAADHPDIPALDALADYLGKGRTSRLYENLVKEKKIAIQCAAFVGYPGSKYPSLFVILSVPSKDHSNEENEAEITAEIEKVKTDLIPAEELEKIKARAKADFINQMESREGLAFQLAYYELIQQDWHRLFKQLDLVNALTPEDLQRVANKYFDLDHRIVAMLENVDK
jgi:predicted Zn-dependent peptidase